MRALRWLAMEDTDSLSVRAHGRLVVGRPGHGRPADRSGAVCPRPDARQHHGHERCSGPSGGKTSPLAFSQIEPERAWWFTAAEIYDEALDVSRADVPVHYRPGRTGRHGLRGRAHRSFADAGLFASTTAAALADESLRSSTRSANWAARWTLARFADIYILPVGVEKVEYLSRQPAPRHAACSARVEVTHFDVESKELRVDVEVGDGEGYVWIRCRGFTYRSFNMINRVDRDPPPARALLRFEPSGRCRASRTGR